MIEVAHLALAFAAGAALGVIFFAGLWWTVRRGVSSQRPELWFFGSMLLRTAVTLAGFYFVGREHWERWLLCLLGFILGRVVVTWRTRFPIEHRASPAPETTYAP